MRKIYKIILALIVFINMLIGINFDVYGVYYSTWKDMVDNDENDVLSDIRNSDNYISYYNILNGVDYSKLNKEEKSIYEKYSNELITSMKKTDSSTYSSEISGLNKKLGKKETASSSEAKTSEKKSEGKNNENLKHLYDYLDGYGVYVQPNVADMGRWTEYYNAFLETNAKDVDDKYIDKYIDFLKKLSDNDLLKQAGNEEHLKQIQSEINELKNSGKKFTKDQKGKINSMLDKVEENKTGISEQHEAENGTLAEKNLEEVEEKNDKIYKQPTKTGKAKDGTLQDMVSDADKFVDSSDQIAINTDDLKKLSKRIYNILLEIGIGASVIIGLVLGIKFLLSGVEEKAEVKKMLWVYVIGCVVTFGAFGIWKLVVTILEQV